MARATARAWRSSPRIARMAARSRSEAEATTSAAVGPADAHAHVERTVMAKGKSALGLVELHRGDAEVEDHAVDGVVAAAAQHRLQIGEGCPPPAPAALAPPAQARRRARSRSGRGQCAIDAAVRRSEDFAAVAAGAERGVHIDPAVAHIEELNRRADEHGNMTSQSASDSVFAVAARHHSRAPCGPSAAPREPSCFLSARTFSVASASSARKRPDSQI